MIRKTISHFRIIEKLGAGGMGVVYRAHDESLDRDVAIKILPEQVAQNPERLTRFDREAKAVAALTHPNIVTIHSVEEDCGVHFITMELVEGEVLSKLLTPSGLPLDRLFDLAIPLADAVNSAHSKGVAHRDLKPANIMIDKEDRLKVLDFGLAKLFDPTIGQGIPADGATIDLASSPTVEGMVLGTPDYMSPEQAEGKPVDHRSDIFSLGIILYEMITGHRPFKGDSPAGTISSILRDTPVSVTDLRSELPHHLGRIIGRCLAKPPNRRYQSALDLRNDLAELRRETESSQLGERSDVSVRLSDSREGSKRLRAVGFAIIAVAAVALGYWQLQPDAGTPDAGDNSARKMLVVLPFENLGPPEDEYFADGITEEITARLAGVRDLGVIARTSAIHYKNTPKTMEEIGNELGVDFVLEGTIRWQRLSNGESQVRVTPQLIRVADKTHLWADVYQEDMGDIFQVQSDIAEKVVFSLDVALMETERKTLTSRPTENIEAYHAYFRGLDFMRHPSDTEEQYRMAVQMFERAVELDPEFSRAYCKIAKSHAAMYHFRHDRTPGRLALAREAVDRALALQPDLPDAHLALGWYYYWGFRDYDRALSEFAIAAENLPNNADIYTGVGAVLRRKGEWEKGIENFLRACDLDPQDADVLANTGYVLMTARRYAEAERFFDRSIFLIPDQSWAYTSKALMLCLWKGDIAGARATLRGIPGGNVIEKRLFFEIEIMGRDYPAVLGRLRAWPEEFVEYPNYHVPKKLYVGLIHRIMGEADLATAAFDSARVMLEALAENPTDNWSLQSSLGITYAGLGRKDEAISAGRSATELLPLEKDAADGTDPVIYLAQIYTMVGEYEAALDQIEYLLKIPSELSAPMLRMAPRWDPLREHPRFQQILQKYSRNGS